ncbi:Alpha/beta hydrolase family-domain-containing protein [Aspergillus sergii]|uniref:Alpha/beta hydrolase family-domain-containing protein n=1 Tax=Aspergillus sergii TaxID=1034303 RepID=A0A5N6X842_9EURO|nr:Alpha/beta hydrolase family-domain-containing protein [Aspergillus sergii]
MSSFPFKIIEHIIPGQHIRESPRSIKGRQETPIKIAIKQYIPNDADRPDPVPENAITIIGVPGNGSPKEIYEPLWEDLYKQLKKLSVPVRGIWVADTSNQGASAILNEDVQGDQTNWYDHSRDLLHMVNHFRDEMPRPIIGVGHSMGCAQLVNLSIIHPRLLSTLVLIEPVILEVAFGGPNPAMMASRRRDLWESPEKAVASLTKGLAKWDPRARDRYLRHALRPVPTRLYNPATDPKVPPTAVTLATTKHQESWNFFTPNLEREELDRLLLPDWDVEKERPYLFSRPECWSAMRNLPYVRPSVLWVFGGKSFLSLPDAQESKMLTTGTGTGGSGGVAKGMVEKAVLPNGGHTLVFEQVDWCAERVADWTQRWFRGWLEDEKFWEEYQSRGSDKEGVRMSEEAFQIAQMPVGTKRGEKPKAKL